MSVKFLVTNADGFYQETLGYASTEYVASSAGVADAGKPILLDAAGLLDASLVNFSTIDHGSVAGLADDDHTQYTLADGSRAFTGPQSMGSNKLTSLADGVASSDAVNKGQLDNAVSGLQDFRESIKDKDLTAPPASPVAGDRYIVGPSATGAWAGLDNKVVEYNGTAWVTEIDPNKGTYVYVEDETSAYTFNNDVFASGSWVLFSAGIYTGSLGVKRIGSDFQADLVAAGGIKLVGNQLRIEPTDFAGAGLVDDGSDNMAIDFSTAFNDAKAIQASDLNSSVSGQGASIIGIEDASAVFTATSVEGALSELYTLASDGRDYVEYTAGAGGVTKGDLCYISGNDTVLPYSTLSQAHRGIGLALTTAAAAAQVKVLANDEVIPGVLTGATAGTTYFWTGSTYSATLPGTSGEHVWAVGTAKNSTDMHVEIRFIKVNI